MQAVIKSGSSQFLVVPGQELLVDRLTTTEKTIVFSDVLLFIDGDQTLVGQPNLDGYSVKAEVLDETQGQKVRVYKFKAKSRYRKHTGFRAKYTKLKIVSISTPTSSSEKSLPKTEVKAKTASIKPKVKSETKTKTIKKVSKTKSTTKSK